MFKIVSFFASILILLSCVQDKPTESDNFVNNGESISLENRIAQLELENSMKDSLINESLSFFNEIQSNLEKIGIRKDEIRAISDNNEISGDDKTWILEQIQHINYLRQENANKVVRMKEQMKKNDLKIKELDLMIESLVKEIQWKDEQISLLQTELHSLDQEYSALFDSYQEQAIMVDELKDAMNTVYYAYGTAKELQENGVIEKKNGFIGIGKKIELKSDLNDDYFTKINALKTNTITIQGTDMRFVTNHPHSSYLVKEEATKTIIEINNPADFWKISKYLVVTVN